MANFAPVRSVVHLFLAVVLLSFGTAQPLHAYALSAVLPKAPSNAILDNSAESLYPAENPSFNPEMRNGLLGHNDPVNKTDPMGLLEAEFGNDNALQRDFNTARQYLSQDAGMRAGFDAVEKSSFRVVVERSSGFNQTGRVEGKDTIVIKWDPRMGAFFPTTKTTQSPAMGLGHEVAGHAQETVKNPGLKQSMREEMRVINKVETPAAKTLGEGVRVKYEGQPIKVQDVLSRKKLENR